MVVLISSYLVLVFLVPVLLSLVVSYRALPRGTACAQCTGSTVPLRRPVLRVLTRVVRPLRVERRWCLHCGWEGLMRGKPDAAPAESVTTGEREAGTALDVRSLRVDGRTWRVQLQCWRDQRHCYGRLVFIEPTGRRWADVVQAFTGSTQFEVLGQALSVSDRLLATRLRQLLIAES